MKLSQLMESDPITPEIKYSERGDKSWSVRIDYGNGKVYVHSNKNKKALEKIVKERYGPKKFV